MLSRIAKKVSEPLIRRVKRNPKIALQRGLFGRRRKPALRIDAYAEDRFEDRLQLYKKQRYYQIEVYGEERLGDAPDDLNLRNERGVLALVDMVDGTDLLERGLSNWCSAAVFFCPKERPGKRILASIVGVPTPQQTVEVYFASSCEDGAYVKVGNSPRRDVGQCSTVEKLIKASICFYGQKAKKLAAVAECELLEHLRKIEKGQKDRKKKGEVITEEEEITARIYNLAGIPMMVKLVDCRVSDANNIDVVFDITGQQPHDVIAGAYIAKKGGAILKRPDGRILEYEDLEEVLMEPKSKDFTYIIAATESLCDQLRPLIQVPSKTATP